MLARQDRPQAKRLSVRNHCVTVARRMLLDHAGEALAAATSDVIFMRLALCEAEAAASHGEVPIGAVAVQADQIVGRAHNAPIGRQDPSAHAEILVLRQAAKAVANYRLPGVTVYVTTEPCIMCAGALIQARVKRVVFGCRDPKAGAFGSVYDVGRDARGNHRLEVKAEVCVEEAAQLLRAFFQERRGA